MMQVLTEITLDRGLVKHVGFTEITPASGGGGSGTVTSVSVVTANGISGSVGTPTTTPAITLTLGAITPTTVNGNTFSTGTGTLALSTYTLTLTGTSSLQGTNTGDQTISLTGDVTGSGTSTFAATIAAGSVTYAKMQDVSAASKLLGRGSASGSGDVEEITLGTQLSMTGTTLNVSSTGAADPRSSLYLPFTVTGDDDEFDDGSFSGWTAVNSGSHNPTITEAGDRVSMLLPGSDAVGELHAYMKARTITPGTASVEGFFRGAGRAQNFNICGMIMADGVTYGAGSQFIVYYSPQETNALRWGAFTNYSTLGTAGSVSQQNQAHGDIGLRLVHTAANTFRGYVSPDGISWIDFTGAITRTLTPTYAGFFVTTWSGTQQFIWSWSYVRFAA